MLYSIADSLAACETDESIVKDVNTEWVIRGHVHVDTEIKFIPTNEVGLVKISMKTEVAYKSS